MEFSYNSEGPFIFTVSWILFAANLKLVCEVKKNLLFSTKIEVEELGDV